MSAFNPYIRILFLAGAVLAGCRDKETPPPTPDDGARPGVVVQSEKQKFRVDTAARGLNSPWGMAFLPDGRILVTEKAGQLRVVQGGQLQPKGVGGVPAVYTNGQGGLLDIALHPDYARNGWLYFTYAAPGPGGGGTTLARARLQGDALTDVQTLFQAQPFQGSGAHFGSRIAFDGQGHVFVSTGDRGTPPQAQQLGNHWGKIMRLRDDGQVPADNPFVGTAGARPEIWSYGHRNVQGMHYDAAARRLWAHEHGPRGGDELNLVEGGKNYGWPLITYGVNYDGTPVSGATQGAGLEQPVRYWVPSIAPSGLALVSSPQYPNWAGNLLVGALVGTHLARVELTNGQYAREEKLLDKIGRVRAVAQGPDGYVYVLTEGPGLLFKLTPER
jgi:glucose/arabinose dehydrogenase